MISQGSRRAGKCMKPEPGMNYKWLRALPTPSAAHLSHSPSAPCFCLFFLLQLLYQQFPVPAETLSVARL